MKNKPSNIISRAYYQWWKIWIIYFWLLYSVIPKGKFLIFLLKGVNAGETCLLGSLGYGTGLDGRMHFLCVKAYFLCLYGTGRAFLGCTVITLGYHGHLEERSPAHFPAHTYRASWGKFTGHPLWIWCKIGGQKSPNAVLRSGLERHPKNGFKASFTCPKVFWTFCLVQQTS